MSVQQMIQNGQQINTNYTAMQNPTQKSYQLSNSDSVEQITQAINQNLAELNVIQNQLSLANNINQENLVKRDQLLRMQNDDLMAQLRELEIIQSNIANKNTMLDQINTNILNEQTNINTLVGCVILAVILLGVIIAYGYGRIQGSLMILLVIIIAVCYVILFFYNYNIFYINTAWNNLFNSNTEARLGQALQTWSTDVKTDINTAIYGTEQNWINQNCQCPPSESEEETPLLPYSPNVSNSPQPGYFYYDGSAPPQLLVPTPVPSEMNENIEWVDYSPNGQRVYNNATNSVTYTNTNYYNYNSNNPENLLQEELDSSNILVNSSTSTINM
jgi:hypothetical protein